MPFTLTDANVFKPQFVFPRPSNPHRLVEASQLHAAVAESDLSVTEGRPAPTAGDRTPADAAKAVNHLP